MITSSPYSNLKLPFLKLGFEMFMYFLAVHSAQQPLSPKRLHLLTYAEEYVC